MHFAQHLVFHDAQPAINLRVCAGVSASILSSSSADFAKNFPLAADAHPFSISRELHRQAQLYHHLARPNSAEHDPFDLITFDDDQKFLHVARRITRCGVEELNSLIDDTEAAKRARIKTGDIGGAILVADEFEQEAIDAYQQRVFQQSDGCVQETEATSNPLPTAS